MDSTNTHSIVYAFNAIAENCKDRTAIRYFQDGLWKSQSYEQLLARAQEVAACLLEAGASRGDAVILPASRHPYICAEMLGILWIGAHYVFVDPSYPAERQELICREAGARFGIDSKQLTSREGLEVIWLNCHEQPVAQDIDFDQLIEAHNNGELPAYIVFTSGSTGNPKGVVIPHRGIIRLVCNTDYVSFSPDEVFLQLSALSFDASTLEIWGPLLNGGTCVLHHENEVITPSAIRESISSNAVTTAWITASYFNELISKYPQTLQGIRQLLVGGEELSVQHIRAGLELLPDTRFYNGYGPTENTTFTTVYPIPRELPVSMNKIPIGSAIHGTKCGVYSTELEMLRPGEAGELIVFGDGVALEYLNSTELNSSRFVEVETTDGERRRGYRTGDLVVERDDGNYDFLGRNDEQVKIDGHRIEPGEIESYLNGLESITEARVIVVSGPKNQKRIAAFIVAQDKIETSQLRTDLANHFPRYMIPHFISYLDRLPKNSSGKLDRESLPDPFKTTSSIALDHTRVAKCWQRLLGRAVAADLNFFDAGGTSLEALGLVKELESEFSQVLSETFVYEFTTIAAQAEKMNSEQSTTTHTYESARRSSNESDIAVIGIACRYPGARNLSEYWNNLISGKETVSFFSPEELDQLLDPSESSSENYVLAKGIIEDCDKFDAEFFDISPLEADLMDPQQRVMLQLCWHAFEDAAIAPGDSDSRTGVFLGANWPRYYQQYILPNKELLKKSGAFNAALANEADFLCTRISYKLNLKGPSTNIFTACSTSLVAISQAAASINAGQCEQALAGGISISTPVRSGYLYQEGSMLSRDGHCRPFDHNASGTTFNDGAGVVLLKRRDLAERDGDPIYAYIKGYAVNNDGEAKASFSAPSIGGQISVYQDALQKSGVDPTTIEFVEAHGTATPLGDPIEVESLSRVYSTDKNRVGKCALGSVKSNIGHTVHAAGIAGFIKGVLAVKHGAIPPTLFFEKPNSRINLEKTCFYVNNEVVDWRSEDVRRAAISALGVGGTNAHVIVEQAPADTPSEAYPASSPTHWAVFSAKSAESLEQLLATYQAYLSDNPDKITLRDLAYTLSHGRRHLDFRFAATARTVDELAEKLVIGPASMPRAISNKPELKTGFMFSGQGSQIINMGRWLYDNDENYRELFAQGSALVRSKSGIDIEKQLFGEELANELGFQINDTIVAQPSLFLLEYSVAQYLLSHGCRPDFMIGHSVGEFVAAALAGVFSFEDAVALVSSRAALMQSMPGGSMLVVKQSLESVEGFLGDEVWLAANNAPALCVFSGSIAGIERVQAKLKEQGIDSNLLPVSHAFHSGMMDPIVDEFRSEVAAIEMHAPEIPIFSTLTGELLSDREATSPDYWATHLRQPVEFSKAVGSARSQYEGAAIAFVEVGPGRTLSTLVSLQGDLENCTVIASLPNSGTDEKASVELPSTISSLWINGFDVDWDCQFDSLPTKRLNLPGYSFKADRHWLDLPALEGGAPVSTLTQMIGQLGNSGLSTNTSGEKVSAEQHLERVEARIVNLLEDVTGYDLTDVSSESEFSEIGLDSLTMTQAAMAIERTFEVGISFRNLMEDYTSLARLSEFIAAEVPTPEAEISPTDAAHDALTGSENLDLSNVAGAGDLESLIKAQIQISQMQLLALQNSSAVTGKAKAGRKAEESSRSKPSHKPGTRISKEKIGIDLSVAQQAWIEGIFSAYESKFANSKSNAQKHRKYLADPRTVSGFNPAWKEIVFPIVTERSKGSRLWDIDGNELIDISNGFGPIFFGHSPQFLTDAVKTQLDAGIETGPQSPLAGEVAELFCELTGNERCTFASTGSEAVAGAVRLARTVTGRSKIVMFEHSYHGIFDEVVNRPGRNYQALPGAPGIPMESTENMLVLPWGEEESIEVIRGLGKELAAVLVEPVQSRHPQFHSGDYLRKLRQVTEEFDSALIFDEVVTGFRVAAGGIQEYFDIRADLATYGKVVGGGYPIGIIGGRSKYMDALDGGHWQFGDDSVPECGVTFFAGTFVRHPVALAAARAILQEIKERRGEIYPELEAKTADMASEAKRFINDMKSNVEFEEFASLFYVSVPDSAHWGHLLFAIMTMNGVNIQCYRPNFLTTAHSVEDINHILDTFKKALAELIVHGLIEGDAIAARTFLNGNGKPLPAGARLGKNAAGEPAYFIEDSKVKGKYIEVGKP